VQDDLELNAEEGVERDEQLLQNNNLADQVVGKQFRGLASNTFCIQALTML
jgi:hypothetical protein